MLGSQVVATYANASFDSCALCARRTSMCFGDVRNRIPMSHSRSPNFRGGAAGQSGDVQRGRRGACGVADELPVDADRDFFALEFREEVFRRSANHGALSSRGTTHASAHRWVACWEID